MEDRTYDLVEKIYVRLSEFQNEMYSFRDEMYNFRDEMYNFRDTTNKRLDKIEINQEIMNDKLDEAFEAIATQAEINEIQHQEILKELKGEISVVELAVRRVAK